MDLATYPAHLVQGVGARRRLVARSTGRNSTLVDALAVAAATGIDDVHQTVSFAEVVKEGVPTPSAEIGSGHQTSDVLYEQWQPSPPPRSHPMLGLHRSSCLGAHPGGWTRCGKPAGANVRVDGREGMWRHGSLPIALLRPRRCIEQGGLASRRFADEAHHELPRPAVASGPTCACPSRAARIWKQLRSTLLSLLKESIVDLAVFLMPPRIHGRLRGVLQLPAERPGGADAAGGCGSCDLGLVVLHPLLRRLEHRDHAWEASWASFRLRCLQN
mmetsp:Transcript_104185/g.334237  ORF Transcript_104185/g.334237 Transcript_104185/m.334237 type:complete len:273 (+) Transcript_104185:967-1785(+)